MYVCVCIIEIRTPFKDHNIITSNNFNLNSLTLSNIQSGFKYIYLKNYFF